MKYPAIVGSSKAALLGLFLQLFPGNRQISFWPAQAVMGKVVGYPKGFSVGTSQFLQPPPYLLILRQPHMAALTVKNPGGTVQAYQI